MDDRMANVIGTGGRMPASAPPTLGFIGAGRTGSALAVALASAGYQVVAVASRTYAHAQRLAGQIPDATAAETAQAVVDAAALVFVTTPDDAIAEVASTVVWHPGQAAVHCSGALSLEPLASATAQGASIGSFHPVHTFGPVHTYGSAGALGTQALLDELRGAAFGIEGEPILLDTLDEMARKLGGFSIRVPAGARGVYHAAAVLVCGYFVGLFDDAASLWEKGGLPRDVAVPALAHLVQATVDSLLSEGVGASQTGPVARGDLGTVRGHLEMLCEQAPELAPVYTALARRAVALATSTGRLPSASLPAWQDLLDRPLSGGASAAKQVHKGI